MSDKQSAEAEREENEPSQVSDAVVAVVDETVKLVEALGKAFVITMQDVSNLMVIKVDADTREHLDLLVDTGVANSRAKAAVSLIEEGIKGKSETLAKVRRTQAQISELRQQMRSLVKVQI